MKKLLKILVILVLVASVFVITCPDKQKHKDALMELFNSKLNEEIGSDGWAFIGSAIGSKVIEFVLDNKLEVSNYFVCSVGHVTQDDGEVNTTSVGILGHVFTMSEEKFSKAVDDLK